MTSRARVFDMLGTLKPILLDTMTRDESVDFLFTRTPCNRADPAEQKAAGEIARELGYLPLALEQAGAFIVRSPLVPTLQSYLALYRTQHKKRLLETKSDAGEYPDSVATTWLMNFSDVEQRSRAAADLLRVSAFLNPDGIPLDLIVTAASQLGDDLSAVLPDSTIDPVRLGKVLEPLADYSLIRMDVGSKTYSIHRLVQDVLRDGLGPDGRCLWARRTMNALNLACDIYTITYNNWTKILPHEVNILFLTTILMEGPQRDDFVSDQAGTYLTKAGMVLTCRKKHKEAALVLKRALQICEDRFGKESLEVAATKEYMGDNYAEVFDHGRARQFYKEVLRVRQTKLRPWDPLLAEIQNNFALSYWDTAEYAIAEEHYVEAMKIWEASKDDTNVGAVLHSLAMLYVSQGRKKKAEDCWKQALVKLHACRYEDRHMIANAAYHFANFLSREKRNLEAEPLYREALAVRVDVFLENSREVLQVLDDFEPFLRRLGRGPEAEELKAWAARIRTVYEITAE